MSFRNSQVQNITRDYLRMKYILMIIKGALSQKLNEID